MLVGTLYSHLADSHMGLANPDTAASSPATVVSPRTPKSPRFPAMRSRSANVARAELYIDRARDCFKRAAYVDGECEQLMKKAMIAKLRGDEKLAEEWAMRHNHVWEEAFGAQKL